MKYQHAKSGTIMGWVWLLFGLVQIALVASFITQCQSYGLFAGLVLLCVVSPIEILCGLGLIVTFWEDT